LFSDESFGFGTFFTSVVVFRVAVNLLCHVDLIAFATVETECVNTTVAINVPKGQLVFALHMGVAAGVHSQDVTKGPETNSFAQHTVGGSVADPTAAISRRWGAPVFALLTAVDVVVLSMGVTNLPSHRQNSVSSTEVARNVRIQDVKKLPVAVLSIVQR
jgi:hypothetical protein